MLTLIAASASVMAASSQAESQPMQRKAQLHTATDALAHCVFRRADDHFVGGCGKLFDQVPAMTLRPAAAITTGIWREDIHPVSIWAGDMTDKGDRASLELEIYAGDWGVLRTEYGWFPVS